MMLERMGDLSETLQALPLAVWNATECHRSDHEFKVSVSAAEYMLRQVVEQWKQNKCTEHVRNRLQLALQDEWLVTRTERMAAHDDQGENFEQHVRGIECHLTSVVNRETQTLEARQDEIVQALTYAVELVTAFMARLLRTANDTLVLDLRNPETMHGGLTCVTGYQFGTGNIAEEVCTACIYFEQAYNQVCVNAIMEVTRMFDPDRFLEDMGRLLSAIPEFQQEQTDKCYPGKEPHVRLRFTKGEYTNGWTWRTRADGRGHLRDPLRTRAQAIKARFINRESEALKLEIDTMLDRRLSEDESIPSSPTPSPLGGMGAHETNCSLREFWLFDGMYTRANYDLVRLWTKWEIIKNRYEVMDEILEKICCEGKDMREENNALVRENNLREIDITVDGLYPCDM